MSAGEIVDKIIVQAASQQGIEIACVVFGILCVWQTVRENPWCWLTGTIQVVLTGYVVFRAGLFADFGLQILYVVLNGYGLYQWLYGGEKKSVLKVSTTSLRDRLILIVLVLPIITLAMVSMLRLVQSDSKTVWLDAYTTALSLVAQVMLANKKLENWFFWVAANLIYIGLYGYKELYYLSAMQIVFIALSVRGWMNWRETLIKQKPGAEVTCPSAI